MSFLLRAVLLISSIAQQYGQDYCALEGEECTCFGNVTYGPLDHTRKESIVRQVHGKIRCDNAAMGGDPSPLVKKMCTCDSKRCQDEISSGRGDDEISCNDGSVNSSSERNAKLCSNCKHRRHGRPGTRLRGGYRCANEGEDCECDGYVSYGDLQKPSLALGTFSEASKIRCDRSSFGGDPAPGSKRKVCTCDSAEKASLPPDFKLRIVWIGDGRRGSLSDVISLFQEAFSSEEVDRISPIVFEKEEEDCGFTLPYKQGVAGVTAAHREAWKTVLGCTFLTTECDAANLMSCYFSQRPVNCTTSSEISEENHEWAVVLEDDALIPPYAAATDRSVLVEEIRRQFALALRDKSDLFYLGFCGDGNVHTQYVAKNWLCTHAYAVTRRAARLLLRHATVECDPARRKKIRPTPAVDWLMYHLCNKKSYRAHTHNPIPRSAKLRCSGVDRLPALFTIFPKNFPYKTNTRGFFVQSTNDSLRKSIDGLAESRRHPALITRELA